MKFTPNPSFIFSKQKKQNLNSFLEQSRLLSGLKQNMHIT